MQKKPANIICLTLLFACLAISGCASGRGNVKEVRGYTPEIGEKAARNAVSMIGMPYKYRGDSPEGFDCSGLVQYSYLAAGLEVPHNTKALRNTSRPVSTRSLQKGDLLFFNEKGGKYSHVAISLGGDCFVHAPSTGKKVRRNCLSDAYWKRHFNEARRFVE